MGSLPFKNNIMSNQLIVKNSNVEGDSLSLEVLLNKLTEQGNANVYVVGIFYEDLVGGIENIHSLYWQLSEFRPALYYTDGSGYIEEANNDLEIIPPYPAYLLHPQKGKKVIIESDDSYIEDYIILGYVITDNSNLDLHIKSSGPESNFVDLSLITHPNRVEYTIPSNMENIYIYSIVTSKTNSINFNHFIKGEEEALQEKFSGVPRGEKLNHIFETINQSNSESISEEVPYSARYIGLFVTDRNKNIYLYSTEKDLSKIEEIKSDIRFTQIDYLEDKSKTGVYKIIEPLYEDETVTTHPHFNITKVGHPIPVIINKRTKTDNYPFYSANIVSQENLVFEVSNTSGVDISSLDIEFYIGDSFSRAYKLGFNKFGNNLGLDIIIHSPFRVKSENLNIYCTIKDGSKMKIYKVNNNIISTFAE